MTELRLVRIVETTNAPIRIVERVGAFEGDPLFEFLTEARREIRKRDQERRRAGRRVSLGVLDIHHSYNA